DPRARLLHRPDRRLEHQVELPGLGQVALRRLAGMLRRLASARALRELIGAEAQLAGAAVDERVGEAGDVPGGLPDLRMEDDCAVEEHDVVALLDQRTDPAVADAVLEQDAVVAVVVAGPEPAVDLRGGEDEP